MNTKTTSKRKSEIDKLIELTTKMQSLGVTEFEFKDLKVKFTSSTPLLREVDLGDLSGLSGDIPNQTPVYDHSDLIDKLDQSNTPSSMINKAAQVNEDEDQALHWST